MHESVSTSHRRTRVFGLAADLPAEGSDAPQARADRALLRRAFAPAHLTERSLERLRTQALLLSQPPGALTLPGPSRPVPAWWLLRRGSLALGGYSEQGEFVARQLLQPGDWLDVAGALAGAVGWLDAVQCRTPVELLALPVGGLFDTAAEDPALLQAIAGLLAGRVRGLSDSLRDVVTADVPARLARWLLRRLDAVQASQASETAPRLVFTELKQTVAAQLGTTSETFSRSLRKLATAGVVRVDGYAVTVLDRAALQAIAWPPGGTGSARQSFGSRRGGRG
ncbi:MAG: Crp/Fnr family transcriptional regulator [Burkholderiaceae bacterium]|nr:Crp/Fnr family transcriptional regulator [Burkholderiaceae bacterium]